MVQLGRLPGDEQTDTDPERAARWEALIGEIARESGITEDESAALAGLFPADGSDAYGVAWTLLHAVESAPGWASGAHLDRVDGPWADVLRRRIADAR